MKGLRPKFCLRQCLWIAPSTSSCLPGHVCIGAKGGRVWTSPLNSSFIPSLFDVRSQVRHLTSPRGGGRLRVRHGIYSICAAHGVETTKSYTPLGKRSGRQWDAVRRRLRWQAFHPPSCVALWCSYKHVCLGPGPMTWRAIHWKHLDVEVLQIFCFLCTILIWLHQTLDSTHCL